MVRLSIALLRRHLPVYTGLALVLVVASTTVAISLALVAAADEHDASLEGLNRNASAKLLLLTANGRTTGGFMAFLACFITVFLVAQTVGHVVRSRRREFALLRIAGALPWQISVIVLAEGALLAVAAAGIGAVLAVPFLTPLAEMLAEQNNWPTGIAPRLHPAALVWSGVLMVVVTVAGSLLPIVRTSRRAPIDVLRTDGSSRRTRSGARAVVAMCSAIMIVGLVVIPVASVSYQIATIGFGCAVVLCAAVCTPFVVTLVTRTFGGLAARVSRRSGYLARADVLRSTQRSSALVAPIVVLLTFATVFGALAQTGRAEVVIGLRALEHVAAVSEVPRSVDSEGARSEFIDLPQVDQATVIRRADGWAWGGLSAPIDDFPQLMEIDPSTFAHFASPRVLSGDLQKVRGTDVAVLSGTAEVGDRILLEAPDGAKISVRVVASVEPTSFIYGSLLVDGAVFARHEGPMKSTVLIDAAHNAPTDSLVTAARRAVPRAMTMSRDQWLSKSVAQAVASQSSSIATIVGGAALLAMATLAQATLASVRARHGERAALRRLGASRAIVVGSDLWSTALHGIASALLSTVCAVLVMTYLAAALGRAKVPVTPTVPYVIVAGAFTACVGVTVVVTMLASLTDGRRRWRVWRFRERNRPVP